MKSKISLNLVKNARGIKIFILGSSFVVGSCIILIFWIYVKTFEKNYANPIQITTQGKIIPSELVQVEDLFAKEARDHLLTFIDYFFSYDQYNYTDRIQKALLLGDHSIQVAYERLKEKELWYNFVVENSIVQKINLENVSISIQENGPHGSSFQIETPLEIISNEGKKTFLLAVRGILEKTKRVSSFNSHGLLITAFAFEKKPLSLNEKKD